MTQRLDGKPVARAMRGKLREEIGEFVTQHGHAPKLGVVLAGSDESSVAYFRSINKTFSGLGIGVEALELPDDVSETYFREQVAELNINPEIHGIIVLQPLPAQLPQGIASQVVSADKDVDGITPESAGRLATGQPGFVPSTPAGGIAILKHYDIPIRGKHAVVVGRSTVVGRPMALLLLSDDATVSVCHSHTEDLAAICRQADILAVAAGKQSLVTPSMIKPGAAVIDFGVNVVDDKLYGDVDPAVGEIAGYLTPVPGGTGAVTRVLLARNTVDAAWALKGRQSEV